MKINVLEVIPDGFFNLSAKDLLAAFGGPTLIILKGQLEPYLFVSCMVHGNEISGLLGVQDLLKIWQRSSRSRSLMIFIGNPQAAALGLRQMPSGADFNRIWSTDYSGPEASMTEQILQMTRERGLFAAIDIHNNSGKNPTYSCLHSQDELTMKLGYLFSPRILYINGRFDTLTAALSQFAPAITVECGYPGDSEGLNDLQNLFKNLLSTTQINQLPSIPFNYRPYEIFATLKVHSQIRICFNNIHEGSEDSDDFQFASHLEDFNFKTLAKDVAWAKVISPDFIEHFNVMDLKGNILTDSYFKLEGNYLRTKNELMPAMLTTQLDIVRSDCLGYLVRKMP